MIEAQDVSSAIDRYLKNLQADKTALAAAGDCSEALAENASLIADTEAARNLIAAGAARRRELRDKAKRHAEILPQCVAARELYETLQRKVQPANDAVIVADTNFQNAKGRLAHHEANPLRPDAYPNSKTIREWNMEKHRLERGAEARRLELVASKAERDKLVQDYRKAEEEFSRLSLGERSLRPPAAPTRIVPTAWRVQEGHELDGIGPNR